MRVENFTVTSLAWSKEEIDNLSAVSLESLKDYVDLGENDKKIYSQEAISSLLKLSSLLQGLLLPTPAKLAEELAVVLGKITEGDISGELKDKALILIIEGALQLPNYLEYLATGSKDIPSVLIDLINELRSVYSQDPICESDLFTVPYPRRAQDYGYEPLTLDIANGFIASQSLDTSLNSNNIDQLKDLSLQANILMKSWLKSDDNIQASLGLHTIFCKAYKIAPVESVRILFWVVSSVFDALNKKQLVLDDKIKESLSASNSILSNLAKNGPFSLNKSPYSIPIMGSDFHSINFDDTIGSDQLRILVYAVMSHKKNANVNSSFLSNQVDQNLKMCEIDNVFNAFELSNFTPDDQSLDLAKQIMSGKNKKVLGVVSTNIKEELYFINERLDLHLRSQSDDNQANLDGGVSLLGPTVESLHKLAEILSVIGLPKSRDEVHAQKDIIESIILGDIEGRDAINKNIFSVASNLLVVEAKINQQLAEISSGPLANAVMQELKDVLVSQSLKNIQDVKNLFLSFTKDNISPDGSYPDSFDKIDKYSIYPIPSLLDEIRGALVMLSSQEAQSFINSLRNYFIIAVDTYSPDEDKEINKIDVDNKDGIDSQDINDNQIQQHESNQDKHVYLDKKISQYENLISSLPQELRSISLNPTKENFQSIADILVSIEYFIEALRDRQPGLDRILDYARSHLIKISPLLDPMPHLDIGSSMLFIQNKQKQNSMLEEVNNMIAQDNYNLANDISSSSENINLSEDSSSEVVSNFKITRDIVPFDGQSDVGLDEDIKEIFSEEVIEEIEKIELHLSNLKSSNQINVAIKEIKKSFHTIKGSGRLIGAMTLGEIAGSCEAVLDRVVGNLRPMSPSVISFIDMGLSHMKSFNSTLLGKPGSWDLDGYMRWAISLFEGGDDNYIPTIQRDDVITQGYFESLLSKSKNPSNVSSLFVDTNKPTSIQFENFVSTIGEPDFKEPDFKEPDWNSLFNESTNIEADDIVLPSVSSEATNSDALNYDLSGLSSQDLITQASIEEFNHNDALSVNLDNTSNSEYEEVSQASFDLDFESSSQINIDDNVLLGSFDLTNFSLPVDQQKEDVELFDFDEKYRPADSLEVIEEVDFNSLENPHISPAQIESFDLYIPTDEKEKASDLQTSETDGSHWSAEDLELTSQDDFSIEDALEEKDEIQKSQFDFSSIELSLEPIEGIITLADLGGSKDKETKFVFNEEPISENVYEKKIDKPSVPSDVSSNEEILEQEAVEHEALGHSLSDDFIREDVIDEKDEVLSKEALSNLIFGQGQSPSKPKEEVKDDTTKEHVVFAEKDINLPPSNQSSEVSDLILNFSTTPYDLAKEDWRVHFNRLRDMQETLDEWINTTYTHRHVYDIDDQYGKELLDKLNLYHKRQNLVLNRLTEEFSKIERKSKSSDLSTTQASLDKKLNDTQSLSYKVVGSVDARAKDNPINKVNKPDSWPTLENVGELTKATQPTMPVDKGGFLSKLTRFFKKDKNNKPMTIKQAERKPVSSRVAPKKLESSKTLMDKFKSMFDR